jgi:hypothetical protein
VVHVLVFPLGASLVPRSRWAFLFWLTLLEALFGFCCFTQSVLPSVSALVGGCVQGCAVLWVVFEAAARVQVVRHGGDARSRTSGLAIRNDCRSGFKVSERM